MLAKPRIFPHNEEPSIHGCLELCTKPFSCPLCEGLVLGCVAMGSAVLCPWKDPACVRIDLMGQESIHGGPPVLGCRFIGDPPGIFIPPAQAEALVLIDVAVRAEFG